LQEKDIIIDSVDLRDFFGPQNEKLKVIEKHFSKLKLISRGNTVKAIGEQGEIDEFESKLDQMLKHYDKYSDITENQIERILTSLGEELSNSSSSHSDEVIVFGNRGLKVKARTHNQRVMVEAISKNDMLFAEGPAGTGKTYTAVALGVRALKNKEVRRIILTRPAVEAGENLGFLPGDLKEKLDPYLRPLYDALRDMIPPEKLSYFMETGVIEIAPLAFMRGRTLDHAFVILDEAQNTTAQQMKMFLTRMGKSAKFIVNGDVSQIDLPKHQKSGLVDSLKVLEGIEGIKIIRMDEKDVIRHRLVKRIIKAFEKNTEK
jgi:phosphate starvation-inducible PhoH-like protein